jgi:hypothetical protein
MKVLSFLLPLFTLAKKIFQVESEKKLIESGDAFQEQKSRF